jgi:hypothetical protein
MKYTDVHQNLEYKSCHPNKCKVGIPNSQAKHYRHIFSVNDKFHESFINLESFFKNRNYPANKLTYHMICIYKVKKSTKEEVLKKNKK